MKVLRVAIPALLVVTAVAIVGFSGPSMKPIDPIVGPAEPYGLPATVEQGVRSRENAISQTLSAVGISGMPPKYGTVRSNVQVAQQFIHSPTVTIFVPNDEARRKAAVALATALRKVGAELLVVRVEPMVTVDHIVVSQTVTDKRALPPVKQHVSGSAGQMWVDLASLPDAGSISTLSPAEVDTLFHWKPDR